jgi:hypothetical protein
MNGPTNTATDRYLGPREDSGIGHGVLTGIETSKTVVGAGPTRQVSNGNAGRIASLRDGIAGLGIGIGRGTSGTKSPNNTGKEAMEVEMQ